MAKQTNLEKARLASEAYAKMIRDMINSLNADLVDLKTKDDRIKLIPVTEDDAPRKMFGAAEETMENYRDYIPPSADQATKKRVKEKFNQIQRERIKFMDVPKKSKPKKSIMGSYGKGK